MIFFYDFNICLCQNSHRLIFPDYLIHIGKSAGGSHPWSLGTCSYKNSKYTLLEVCVHPVTIFSDDFQRRWHRFMNPGPFSMSLFFCETSAMFSALTPVSLDIKEHVAITIMSSTAAAAALAISIFAAQDLYYNVRPNAAVGIFTFV